MQAQCHRGKKGPSEPGVLAVALPPAHYTPIHESFLYAGPHWLHWLVSKGISNANDIGYDDIQESLKYLLFIFFFLFTFISWRLITLHIVVVFAIQ